MSDAWREVFFPDCPSGKEGGFPALAEMVDFKNCCVAEYVWLDGKGQTRSKVKTMNTSPETADDCTIWTFNGTPCDQAEPSSSDVYLVPRKVFRDPFRGAPHVMVICECITSGMEPAKGNYRAECADVMEKYRSADPWFGLEQEYIMCDKEGVILPVATSDAYCGRGALNLPNKMREIMGDHYAMCLSAGIKISGMNCESAQSQAEFQIGPCKGLNAGDHLVAARHTLHKCANKHGVSINFTGFYDDNSIASGMHCNFSSRHTRADGGLQVIEKVCRALGRRTKEALTAYGSGNEKRLNGKNDTSEMNAFKFGVADRGAAIRIPRAVGIVAKGYLEDRRPAANADPYRVTAHIMKTAGEVLANAK